ncbi:hypothetical protein BKA67DRAFT_81340 [Truncatella angustata]|uniref:Uncharacterized protein n=1 Tax=Truncatella angustata TaxID=152316 RepID=A0A9P8UZ83_9PEZI|nr:uncharacterized protein BKA67DRAFT_81340 [Truncatella angustata]KAH6661301.1 hypothetical protein BKA67DRAFT_81340 [Truncatella angustata]
MNSTRMYKDRFTRWGWLKYSRRKPPEKAATASSRHFEQHEKGTFNVVRHQSLSSPTRRMLTHQHDLGRSLDMGYRALKVFIQHWAENDPRWKATAVDSSMTYHTLPGYVTTAVGYFQDGKVVQGGKFLRLAFLDIEHCIKDSHLLTTIGLFLDYGHPFIQLPPVRGVNLFQVFSQYVYQQATIHFREHPIALISKSLLAVSREGNEQVRSWIRSMFRLVLDLFRLLRGYDETTMITQTLFLSRFPDRDIALDFAQHQEIRIKRLEKEFGRDDVRVLRAHMALMWVGMQFHILDDELEGRLERLCARARSLFKYIQDRDQDVWLAEKELDLFRGSHFLLASYWGSKANIDRMVEACQEVVFLEDEPSSIWASRTVAVIELLRQYGVHDEADRIDAWRKQVELPPSLEALLED